MVLDPSLHATACLLCASLLAWCPCTLIPEPKRLCTKHAVALEHVHVHVLCFLYGCIASFYFCTKHVYVCISCACPVGTTVSDARLAALAAVVSWELSFATCIKQ